MSEIGNLVRQYRTDTGLSQFELELEINASHGSISRIENGYVNPTKETLADIAYALKLNSRQIASFYGIKVFSSEELLKSATKLLEVKNINEFSGLITDNLIFKLGYIASAFFIVKENEIITMSITKTNISEAVFEILGDMKLEDIRWNILYDTSSKLVEAVSNKRPLIVQKDSAYLAPAIPENIGDLIQEKTGDKDTLIYPLIHDDDCLGVLVIASKVSTDFSDEMTTIQAVISYVSILLAKLI